MQDKENEDKLVDVKGTFESFIEDTLPELSQEDAIKNYKSNDTINYKRKKKTSSDEDDESEEDEHLKRLKMELLASLERVNKLAKQLFNEKEYINSVKVKKEPTKYKAKEKVIEEMRQKVQDEKERSREE